MKLVARHPFAGYTPGKSPEKPRRIPCYLGGVRRRIIPNNPEVFMKTTDAAAKAEAQDKAERDRLRTAAQAAVDGHVATAESIARNLGIK